MANTPEGTQDASTPRAADAFRGRISAAREMGGSDTREGEYSEGQPVNLMVLDGLRLVGQTAP